MTEGACNNLKQYWQSNTYKPINRSPKTFNNINCL
jgi:hypothetical protein